MSFLILNYSTSWDYRKKIPEKEEGYIIATIASVFRYQARAKNTKKSLNYQRSMKIYCLLA
jgi:hypothetical protein